MFSYDALGGSRYPCDLTPLRSRLTFHCANRSNKAERTRFPRLISCAARSRLTVLEENPAGTGSSKREVELIFKKFKASQSAQ